METVDLNVLGFQVDVPTFANGSGPLAAQLGVFTMRCNPLSAKHGPSYEETLHRLHHASHHTPSSNELQSLDHDGNYKKTSAAYLAVAKRVEHVRGGAPLLALQGLPPPVIDQGEVERVDSYYSFRPPSGVQRSITTIAQASGDAVRMQVWKLLVHAYPTLRTLLIMIVNSTAKFYKQITFPPTQSLLLSNSMYSLATRPFAVGKSRCMHEHACAHHACIQHCNAERIWHNGIHTYNILYMCI